MGKNSEGKGSLPHELKRSINLFQAIMYDVGRILAAGIYVILVLLSIGVLHNFD